MGVKETGKRIRQKMRMQLFQEPVSKQKKERTNLDKKIFGMLQGGLEQVSEDIPEEQRQAVIQAFMDEDYQRTIDLIVEIRDAIGKDETSTLRQVAGYVNIKYLGGFTLY
ncbi:MAG: hypothetical protein KAT77_02950 [Nanoarchaeota archaeon]|nr:hypothetical protein [Nanoarchaeota archaeon]